MSIETSVLADEKKNISCTSPSVLNIEPSIAGLALYWLEYNYRYSVAINTLFYKIQPVFCKGQHSEYCKGQVKKRPLNCRGGAEFLSRPEHSLYTLFRPRTFFSIKREPRNFFLKKKCCGQLTRTFFLSNMGQDIFFFYQIWGREFFFSKKYIFDPP